MIFELISVVIVYGGYRYHKWVFVHYSFSYNSLSIHKSSQQVDRKSVIYSAKGNTYRHAQIDR